jgi:hypothetical protein
LALATSVRCSVTIDRLTGRKFERASDLNWPSVNDLNSNTFADSRFATPLQPVVNVSYVAPNFWALLPSTLKEQSCLGVRQCARARNPEFRTVAAKAAYLRVELRRAHVG